MMEIGDIVGWNSQIYKPHLTKGIIRDRIRDELTVEEASNGEMHTFDVNEVVPLRKAIQGLDKMSKSELIIAVHDLHNHYQGKLKDQSKSYEGKIGESEIRIDSLIEERDKAFDDMEELIRSYIQ